MKGVVLPLAITLAVQALTSMAMIAPSVMAPVAAAELGVAPQGIGWFVALEYFVAMASGLVCGALIRRYGPVRVCQISVCLAAAGLAAGTGGRAAAVFAAAGLIGSGYGLVNPVSSHILARAAPPRMMSLIFSIKQTGVPLGGALAGALVPPLVLYAELALERGGGGAAVPVGRAAIQARARPTRRSNAAPEAVRSPSLLRAAAHGDRESAGAGAGGRFDDFRRGAARSDRLFRFLSEP